jgi:hydroxyethylthiazole kinase-like uncharacterized protein yjeF
MAELVTAAQMRAIEQAAIASGEVTGLELMERAGRGVVEAILEEWPELEGGRRGALPPGAADAALPPGYLQEDERTDAPLRAVVLCGPGNNGGDGFVVARLLKERGWEVEVFLHGDPARLPPDARVNHDRWAAMGEARPLTQLNDEVDERPGREFDIIVDAIFGIGQTRTVPDDVRTALCNIFMGYLVGNVVAVDVPTGLCGDSGRALVAPEPDMPARPALHGRVAEAALTVTFHRAKLGHHLAEGPRHCGQTTVCDIGLPQAGRPDAGPVAKLASAAASPELRKGGGAHKYTHGHALILSGPPGRVGAARLAARGALRIGAGVVTVGCPPDAVPENAARLDAIMLRDVADAGALAALLEDPRITALCLGPGLGTGEREAGLVAAALGLPVETSRVPHASPPSPLPRERGGAHDDAARALVLDADALTILSRRPDLFAALHGRCVLTPHAGEFARLFPDIAARLDAPATSGPAYSKVDATRAAAARAGCVVLFKGPDTVIADPSGRCAINAAHCDRAAPWLATAGSGDVLAGFITGLLARGFDPTRAAETAAWLHVECALSFGPALIAEDLPEELPRVFRALGL